MDVIEQIMEKMERLNKKLDKLRREFEVRGIRVVSTTPGSVEVDPEIELACGIILQVTGPDTFIPFEIGPQYQITMHDELRGMGAVAKFVIGRPRP